MFSRGIAVHFIKKKEEEIRLREIEEQKAHDARIAEEKRIEEENARIKEWERRFDEEQRKKEEEMIKKLNERENSFKHEKDSEENNLSANNQTKEN